MVLLVGATTETRATVDKNMLFFLSRDYCFLACASHYGLHIDKVDYSYHHYFTIKRYQSSYRYGRFGLRHMIFANDFFFFSSLSCRAQHLPPLLMFLVERKSQKLLTHYIFQLLFCNLVAATILFIFTFPSDL